MSRVIATPALCHAQRVRASTLRQLLRVVTVVLAASLACELIQWYFDPANLILVYLTGVVYVALRSERWASLLAIAASILVFDWVFVPPRWSFKPTDPQYYFTFLVMAAMGLLISELTARAREQARQRQQAAVEAESERVRNTLLASLSHDFRTPLTTIVGASTTLIEQAQDLAPAQREALLRSVHAEAQRMHRITSGLLDLTRLQEGAVTPRCEWCPAADLVDEAARASGDRLAGRALRVSVPEDQTVWCDPLLVEQVLVNLLDNAVKHAPEGRQVWVRCGAGAGRWWVEVHDDGAGFPEGSQQEVFRRFRRAPGTQREGVGLGLAICAAITRLHGGQIEARNESGAVVRMSLPQPAMLPEALES
jgi:K+-sensing histidine kinase KdpD